jgi:hypothetical protein
VQDIQAVLDEVDVREDVPYEKLVEMQYKETYCMLLLNI